MVFYHGSSVGGIDVLLPKISEHKEPYIYFSTNPVVASFYMVHIVERPFNWFPYGFNEKGIPIYTEYYHNATADVYGGRQGYLYECQNVLNTNNPTNISCAYACKDPVTVGNCVVFNDIYDRFKEFEKQGHLIIKKFESLSEKELAFAQRYLLNLIAENNLKSKPQNSLSLLIMRHFPQVWETVL